MIPATKLAVLVLVCCLGAGCAVKRPVVIKVLPEQWVVHCPSDPGDDGAWWRLPSNADAKQYCQFWHKWNHKTLAERWRSSEQAYARYVIKMCEKSHPAEECDPMWKPCAKDERCQP